MSIFRVYNTLENFVLLSAADFIAAWSRFECIAAASKIKEKTKGEHRVQK